MNIVFGSYHWPVRAYEGKILSMVAEEIAKREK